MNFSGSAVALNWENENLPAIIQAFYPGETTGTALAGLLFGDFNPSGRLPVTFYKSVDQLPDFKNYEMTGRTYRYFYGEPLYPFGFGLSYTRFEYSNLKVLEPVNAGQPGSLTFDLFNSGNMNGEEVVQVYISNKNIENAPIKSLKNFKRMNLKAGEKQTIKIELKRDDFAIVNNSGDKTVYPGEYEIVVGGSSVGPKQVVQRLKLE